MLAIRRLSHKLFGGARIELLKKMPKGSVCAEIGVHKGNYSRTILDMVEPARLHLIDPWKHEDESLYRKSLYGGMGPTGQAVMDVRYHKVQKRFLREIGAGQVVIHRDFSHVAAREFPEHYFDWIYIDGNHLFEFVKKDLEAFYPKIKPGGFLTGDDYGAQGWWGDGVRKAVSSFVSATSGVVLTVINEQFIITTAILL
jgi:hypothetical protein